MVTFSRFHIVFIIHIFLSLIHLRYIQCFSLPLIANRLLSKGFSDKHLEKVGSTVLFGGIGIAKDYSWKEEQFEIELNIPVPMETKQSDVIFTAKLQSIQLSIRTKTGIVDLVDSHRQMRGRIDIDGTFWSFSDTDKALLGHKNSDNKKFIVINIEKMVSSSADQFDVVEYDWGGIYRDDDKEVISKKYAEPEVLNVREYAASMGVDIDNIDMSKVDKNMFTSGLNMTRSSLDELCKVGYAREITRQNDGNEFTVDENGESIPFDFLGEEVGKDEIAHVMNDKVGRSEATSSNSRGKHTTENPAMKDPIDLLPSDKLRDILNTEGISTEDDATDGELRTTLKNHIQVKLSKRKIPKENTNRDSSKKK